MVKNHNYGWPFKMDDGPPNMDDHPSQEQLLCTPYRLMDDFIHKYSVCHTEYSVCHTEINQNKMYGHPFIQYAHTVLLYVPSFINVWFHPYI